MTAHGDFLLLGLGDIMGALNTALNPQRVQKMSSAPPLVSTDWLAARLAASVYYPDVKILDATYIVPPTERNAAREFEQGHIPGAVFFDIDAIAKPETDLPHMLPDAYQFGLAIGKLGVGNDDHVVAYDTHGLMSAARVWWMFRAFGHERVSILDGGFPKWRAEGHPVETGPANPLPNVFSAVFRPELVRDKAQILANLARREEQILDLRPAGRFEGRDPEPRAGLRLGHIPGGLNLPWSEWTNPTDKTMLSPEAIRQKLTAAGVDVSRPVACACGSGVTACVGAFGLFLLGLTDVPVYDGSWAEWGREIEGLPVETGRERVSS